MTKSPHPPSPKTRKPTVLALSLILAATCLAARSEDSPKALVMLRAVETQPAADGSGTRITFHGSHPLSYSLSPVEGRSWSLTMNGVDCRDVPKEIAPGTAQVSRVRIHPVVGTKGRSATRVDFELPGESDRRVRLNGNDLMVELTSSKPIAAPAVDERPSVVPAVATSAPPVVAVSAEARHDRPRPLVAPSLPRVPALGVPDSSRDLVVANGKSLTLDLEAPAARVSVADPAIADALVVSPQQLLINGLTHGSTTLILWLK